MPWEARAPKVGEKAPDLELLDQAGEPVTLSSVAGRHPLVLIAFSGLHEAAGLRLLCDYRDDTLAIWRAGARLCAIGPATPAQLQYLKSARGFGFPLLADPGGAAMSGWGLTGREAVFLLDRDLVVRHRAALEDAAPETMLSIVRRGGARAHRPTFAQRMAHFSHAVQHAFRALRPVR